MTEKVFAPQAPEDDRQVVRSFDERGKAVFGQVDVAELSYKGRFGAITVSHTENSISVGQHLFVIDDPDNMFRVGDDILITSLDDVSAFMWAEIINKGSGPTLLTVHVEDISQAGNITSSNWELQVVARPKIGITKDTSTSSVDPTAAGPFTLTVTAGKFFPVGGKLLMIPLADRTIALVGLVKAYNGTSLVVALWDDRTEDVLIPQESVVHPAEVDRPQPKPMSQSTIANGATVGGGFTLAGIAATIWDKITTAPSNIQDAIIAAAWKPAFWFMLLTIGACAFIWWRRRKMQVES